MRETAKYTKLLARMKKHSYNEEDTYSAVLLLEDMIGAKIVNVSQFQRDLENVIGDPEQFLDYWAEGKAALTLAVNGLAATMRPQGQSGADMLATWCNHDIYVEFARFRADYDTEQKLRQPGPNNTLPSYGRGEKDVLAFYTKVLEEASQLPLNEIGLVFLKSDNVRIEDIEFDKASWYLDKLMTEDQTYPRLSGILFDSGWVNVTTRKRFYLFLNPQAAKPLPQAVVTRLEALREPALHLKNEIPCLRKRFPIPE